MLIHDIVMLASGDQAGLVRLGDDKFALHVPPGMETMDAGKAFALLYKTFWVFRHTERQRERLAALDGMESQAPAGLNTDGTGSPSFHDALGLDELFEQADEMRLLGLRQGRGRRAADLHARLDRHLHLALYDEEGVPYLEHVPGQRREMHYGTDDIVGLYCFVADDFYRRFLGVDISAIWGRFAGEGLALATDFRQRYLHEGASLHDGEHDACEQTIQRLRHTLRAIDRRTPFRSPEYRFLHEALHRYLHGGIGTRSTGLIWGVQDFWAVWESICLVHAMAQHGSQFLTCDFEHLPRDLGTSRERAAWLAQRRRLFSRNEVERRPDLVLASAVEAKVIDFKFYTSMPSSRPKATDGVIDKRERDFLNIEAYGLLLQNDLLRTSPHLADHLSLEFWLPGLAHGSTSCARTPPWNPSLSIVTLPTTELVEAYSKLYRAY
jgi:hypothetical protein